MTDEEKTANEADSQRDSVLEDSALEDSLRSVRALGENRTGATEDED